MAMKFFGEYGCYCSSSLPTAVDPFRAFLCNHQNAVLSAKNMCMLLSIALQHKIQFSHSHTHASTASAFMANVLKFSEFDELYPAESDDNAFIYVLILFQHGSMFMLSLTHTRSTVSSSCAWQDVNAGVCAPKSL